MSLSRVEGHQNLRKDTSNGGVVDVDKNSYNSYKQSKMFSQERNQKFKKTQSNVSDLQIEINTLKEDMTDIKVMLLKLIEKGD
jgi:hypothetical protein